MSCLARRTHSASERVAWPTFSPRSHKHVEDEFDDAFAPGRLLERTHEQQIDVGAGRQFAAAITAGGDDGDALRCRRVLCVVEMLGREIVENLDRGVLHIGQRARGGEARQRAASTRRLDDARAHPGNAILMCASAALRSLAVSLSACASAVSSRRSASPSSSSICSGPS